MMKRMFIDDNLITKEEIQMKLDKIDRLEKEVAKLKIVVIQLKGILTRLQDQKRER